MLNLFIFLNSKYSLTEGIIRTPNVARNINNPNSFANKIDIIDKTIAPIK